MDLQLDQDVGFQRRDWAAQRVAWVLMALFVLAAAVGLLGPGPLSHSRAQSTDDTVTVDYLRWARRGREANLTVRVDPSHVQEGRISVELPSRYFDDMRLRGVVPHPEQVEANGDTVRFIFAAPRADAPTELEFDVQADGMGLLAGEVRVGGAIARFSQFLWP